MLEITGFKLYEYGFHLQVAQTYAQENGLFFMETSAKTAANVNEIFHEIGKPAISKNISQHLS